MRSGKDGEEEEKLVRQEKQKQDEPHLRSQLLLESPSCGPGPPTPPTPTCAASRPFPAAAQPPARPRSPWLRAFAFLPGQGSPAGSRSPAPPLPCRPRPARTAGGGRWRRTAASRPGRPGPPQKPPEAGGRERVSPARPPSPAPDSSYLGRRGGRRGHQHGASATSAAQLRPSARVTSSPALPERGAPRQGSGWRAESRPAVSACRRHTPSAGLGDSGIAVWPACAGPGCSYLCTALPRCPPVLSVITTSPLSHSHRINHLLFRVRRQDTGVPSACRSPPLICQPLQVFPGQGRGEIRATVHAYTGFCLGTLADLHERTLHRT